MLLNNHGHRPFCIDRIAGIALLLAWNDRTVMLFVLFPLCNVMRINSMLKDDSEMKVAIKQQLGD